MRTVKLGLAGLGTIGAEVYRLIARKRIFFGERAGVRLEIGKILVRHAGKKRFAGLNRRLLTTRPQDILKDPSIDLVIELMGGIHPARRLILEALKNGKDVVTANKALLAEEGKLLFRTAERLGRQIFFEASVGGGIPVIKALREGLSANRIHSVLGILNGTSNYILSQMSREGVEFAAALEAAQERGYAEPDPALDIDGVDAAHKIALLARFSFGADIPFGRVSREGIRHVDREDIAFAEKFGYSIKLLAAAKRFQDGIEVRVSPALLPRDHILAKVDGSFNAVMFDGDEVGEVLLYGKGAGPQPTASAVLSDVLDWARGVPSGGQVENRFSPALAQPVKFINVSSMPSRFYLRFSVIDKPGVLSKISGVLGAHKVSISDVIQMKRKSRTVVPLILLTHHVPEAGLRAAFRAIDAMRSIVRAKSRLIRIEV